MAGLSLIAKNSLQYYVVDSNEALEFKLVRKAEDLENEETTFKPEMSHQVYGDSEQIFGYSGLCIKLYYTAGRLITYLTHTYTDKVHPDKYEGIKPDEVIKPIAEKIPPGYITNLDDFTAALQKEPSFVPFGDLERRFTARTEEGKEKTFEVYRCCASTPGFLPYHENFQTFILWYIDAASYIDVDDDKWRFFVTYEKYEVEGRQQYAFTGYTTVYEYYAYPANVRPRISQMLVLPPFQRMGIGAEMLNTIYSNYQTDSRVLDITVEDPSENFARLRDFVDAKNCLTLDNYSKGKLTEGFTEAMADEARQKLKLNKRQARKVYEILRLQNTNRADKEAYLQYRLEVKNRLNVQYKKEDRDMVKLKKILKPEEFAATMSITSKEQRLENLERQYSELEDHYLKVLERLSLS